MNIVYNGEKDSRLFKNVLGDTIARLLNEDENVVYLDADLMSCICTSKLPAQTNRAIDCGIAEANMVGIGCGMSAVGFKPIVHTFGPFASRRCYDQAFLSGAYARNSITIIGTDPGITAAFNGGTHMPFEDMALYRAMPNAVIADITDVPMLVDMLEQFKDMPGVKYIRVPRKDSRQVYADGSHFQVGKGCVLREGSDAVIVACGIMVHEAMQAAKQLEADGIQAAVIDVCTVKPIDEELLKTYAAKTGVVVTAENHNRIGGLTSAVKDVLCGMPLQMGYVAVEDEFGEVGPQDYLRERFELTDEHIAQTVKAAVAAAKR
jgi:transketolase